MMDARPEVRHAALLNEGIRLQHAGRHAEAAKRYRELLRENPRHADAMHLLGLAAEKQGKPARAVKLIRAAIEMRGIGHAVYHNNLGYALTLLEQIEAAEKEYQTAVSLDCNLALAWINLAILHRDRGRTSQAIDILKKGARLCSDRPKIIQELGNLLIATQCFEEAAATLEQLVQIDPQNGPAWTKLGAIYIDLGHREKAMKATIAALKCDPDQSIAKYNLSIVFLEMAAPHEAEQLLLAALDDPRMAPAAYGNLGNVYKDLGYVDLALDCFARCLNYGSQLNTHSNFLYTLLYDESQDDQEVADEHRLWAKQFTEPMRPAIISHDNDADPRRPLRVGYVSGHFRDHAVALFSEPMLAAHDPANVQVYCYSCTLAKDHVTDRFRSRAHQWRDVHSIDDAACVELIRDDRIDILVDMAGHIAGNRLTLFGPKPAPIQATYLGYQATTGMSVMDYRLTDAIADPPGVTDRYYIEQLTRLDPSFFVYLPSDYAPPVTPSPAMENGFVTFGCLNNPTKTTERVVDLWSQLLRAVPGSRLLLLGPTAHPADPRVSRLFVGHGLGEDRVQILGKRNRPQYLANYGQIDIGLDPFPFSGHTTTCDALWQGVPVITLAGKTYAGRMSACTLHQARLPHLVARSTEHYLQIAIDLASDRAALAGMRQTLRDHLATTPMLDARGFTRGLEATYRQMWCKWCENLRKA